MGGEPLCPENLDLTLSTISAVRAAYPDIKIFLWTGYCLEDIKENPVVKEILEQINVLIDGPYIQEKRDITLKLRGSKNQRILYHGIDF